MQKLNKEELEAYKFTSSFFYNVFFNGINKELWQSLQSQNVAWFLQSSSIANKKGVEFLQKSLKEESLENITVDFTNLFICNEGFLKAPPYASYYLDNKGEIYSQETIDVRKFYTQFGYNIKIKNEPEDQLAFEIGFLHCLFEALQESKDNEERHYEVLSKFLSYHLLPWVFNCLQLVQSNASSYFYKAMAFLTEDFLSSLQETLNIKVQKREIYTTLV